MTFISHEDGGSFPREDVGAPEEEEPAVKSCGLLFSGRLTDT